MNDAPYTGTKNLEVMKEAVNYNRALLDLVMTHARKGSRIVDFGAGAGTFAIPMHRAGYDVECVELDDEQRGVIEANGLSASPTLAGFPDARVDFVSMIHVLEHIDDDAAALREIGRTLRDRGKLLVYVPAFDLLFTSMDRRVGHLRRYRRMGLRAKVEAAGFAVLAAEYVDSLGFLATLAYRFAGSASGDIDRRALRFYDRFVFPVSRWSDRILKRVIGKNVLVVAERRA
jgi:2-polyprenyl-3-methyl-5-hydroxy-6-metoxy-1,4-benzoquinol methylase